MRISSSFVVLALVTTLYACEGTKTTTHEVKKEQRIMDQADLLTGQQEDSLFASIQDLEKNIGSQIAVLTISSLNGEKIEEYSLRVAEKSRFGREKYDDGILITVAHNDRQMRIEVGYGLEKIITDDMAARIIREQMAPRFANTDYFNGIKAGVETLKALIEDNNHLIGVKP